MIGTKTGICAGVLLGAPAFLAGGEPDLWALWRLNETSGMYALEDAHGYYGEYINGPSLGLAGAVDSCGNSAVGFNGENQWVLAAGFNDSMNFGTDSLTVAVRFRKTTDSTRMMKLVNKGLTISGTPQNAGYALRIRDGIIEFSVGDGATYNNVVAPEPAVGAWHFAAGVLDRDAGEARLYLDPADESPAAVLDVSGLGSVDTNVDFAIAALDRSPIDFVSEHFEGAIDEVRIYRGAMTGEQILALAGEASCPPDVAEPLGLLDLADINAFISAFVAGDEAADLAPPCGLYDLTDVTSFVTAFVAGCGDAP